MKTDIDYMNMAAELGRKAANMTSPNPRVGCVIVKGAEIIGKGYHKRFGSRHAEIEAIDSSSCDTSGARMYVTLEPCTHFGKTPPCVPAIINAGIKEVFIGSEDPDPDIKGIEQLREHGIAVTAGISKNETDELIKDYLVFKLKKRPFITVKAAMSWDGKIATETGDSQWISSIESREYAMSLRGENDAVLVGKNTVINDNPMLTYRNNDIKARQPVRVIIDPHLQISTDSKAVSENTVIFTCAPADRSKASGVTLRGAEIKEIEGIDGLIPPLKIIEELYSRSIMSVLIEGGGATVGNFFSAGLVDRVIFVYAPLLIGGGGAPTVCDGRGAAKLSEASRLHNIKRTCLGDDIIMQGDIR